MIKIFILLVILYNGDDGGNLTTEKFYFRSMKECRVQQKVVDNKLGRRNYFRRAETECIQSLTNVNYGEQ